MLMASSRSRMCGTAAADSSLLTVIRTSSEPARARALTCATVPSISAVSVLVMDCTTIGALRPIVTAPTFTARDVLREIIPQLYQGDALGHAHHHGACNLLMPGLGGLIEGYPEESQSGHRQGQKTAQGADNGRFPVHEPSIQAHDPQIEHDASYGRSAQFPHHGPVDGQQQQMHMK